MLDVLNTVLGIVPKFVNTLNAMVITEWQGADLTMLGLLGALITVSIMIRVFMPQP